MKIYQLNLTDYTEVYNTVIHSIMVSTKVSDIEDAIREIESPQNDERFCTIDVWEDGNYLKSIVIPFWMND